MKKIFLLLITLCSLNIWAEQSNGIIYVVPNGTGAGNSWTDALGDIQTAINQAVAVADAPKDVWVKAGEYTISVTVSMADGVNVYGGFMGNEASLEQRAKTAGGKAWDFTNASVLKGNNCRIIHYLNTAGPTKTTILDGFTLTNGNGVNTSSLNGNGGAIVMRNNFTVQNCIVKNSSASNGNGGAINMTGGTVKNCWILNNSQSVGTGGGGGIYTNPASGITITVENCVLESNSSTVRGGAMNVQGVGITNCNNLIMMNNKADNGAALMPGGAVYVNSATNTFANCLIFNNSGTNVFQAQGSILNSTIVNNIGGVYYAGTPAVKFINNIVWGCVVTTREGIATSVAGNNGASMICKNNATYNPVSESLNWQKADNILFSSNISNGDIEDPMPGTVGSGPKFNKPTTFKGVAFADEEIDELKAANWTIKYNSPCLDKGLNIAEVTLDLVGNNRPAGFPQASAKFDIGAYELPYYNVLWDTNAASNGEILNSDYAPVNLSDVIAYPSGINLSYILSPNQNYTIARAYYKTSSDGGASFTGSEVNLTQGEGDVWTTGPVSAPIKIFVTWKVSTSLDNSALSSTLQVRTSKGSVELDGVDAGKEIFVYNAMGQLIYKTISNNTSVSIPLNTGYYVIKAGNEVVKVVVR